MRILSSLHDPKKERYAIYYTSILLIVIASTILVASGIIKTSPIEGMMIFIEGFIALFMLARHEKVSHSFANHISAFDLKFRNGLSLVSRT